MCDEDDGEWPALNNDEIRVLCEAVGDLHRQAHQGDALGVRNCKRQPCASLSLDLVSEIDKS